MIGPASLTIVAGVVLVRLGWGGRVAAAVAGWTSIAAALAACARGAGAWGLAVGTVAGMAAALAVLLGSGWATPARAWRPDRERVATRQGRAPVRLMRRSAVFLLVVPAGGIASLVFAFGAQAAGRRAGAGEADAAACFLLLLPLVWAGLSAWQMTRDGPRRMVAPPLLLAGLGGLLCAVR